MEYFWMIVAALGAGIGTGLAGISAATVMVPVMIVLCPSFAGETGAYQATAIALASDILGSAVTTWTYARHGNIDLKRGWVMLVCILTMCTVGSYVAWLAGNVVLGSFTLFLTFFIGIRFLVKPDTSRETPESRGKALDLKGIAISLFFGLTIGFGTGFVGTGGGMMMLIVFTAFLGMELKTAVGTSTLIMTFTALIASVSHILIHPAILLQRWDALLICMTVATAASLVSARFANRVNNKTVGLVTGAVLTILGAAMLILRYWDVLSSIPLMMQTISCLGKFLLYLLCCIAVLLPLYLLVKMPKHVFRKLLHAVAFSCITVMIIEAESWLAAVLASAGFAAAIYPVLKLLQNQPWYGKLFQEKSKGEVCRSLVMLFVMFAAVTAVSWGIFDKRQIACAAILMWGFGDAAAALVGIPLGRHKVISRWTDGKKSYEGSLAMLTVSLIVGCLFLYLSHTMPISRAIPVAIAGSLTGTVVELFSHSEHDTVTVPVAILVVLLLF